MLYIWILTKIKPVNMMSTGFGGAGGTWTHTIYGRQILSLLRLPFRHNPGYGANGGNRTHDLFITSELLYPWATLAYSFGLKRILIKPESVKT